MPRVLYLLPDLDYRGHARQASLLATSLPRDSFPIAIATLGEFNAMSKPLEKAVVPVHRFHRSRRFDFQHWIGLRRLIREFQPDLIHVWGLDALRTLWYASFLKRSCLPPVLLSLPPSWPKNRRLDWRDRLLLARVARFVATCESDRVALAAAGRPAGKIRLIRPGVTIPQPRPSSNLPFTGGPVLMSCGHMRSFGRLKDSVWIAEILAYVLPNLQLVMIGEGRYQEQLIDYLRDTSRIPNNVHMLNARPDAPDLLASADVVLVAHRQLGGTYTTLEAMAAGKAVVAARLPHLEGLIRHGETGMLGTPADQPGLARACLRLLENESLRTAIGNAAREIVIRQFSRETMTANFAAVYEETAGN